MFWNFFFWFGGLRRVHLHYHILSKLIMGLINNFIDIKKHLFTEQVCKPLILRCWKWRYWLFRAKCLVKLIATAVLIIRKAMLFKFYNDFRVVYLVGFTCLLIYLRKLIDVIFVYSWFITRNWIVFTQNLFYPECLFVFSPYIVFIWCSFHCWQVLYGIVIWLDHLINYWLRWKLHGLWNFACTGHMNTIYVTFRF